MTRVQSQPTFILVHLASISRAVHGALWSWVTQRIIQRVVQREIPYSDTHSKELFCFQSDPSSSWHIQKKAYLQQLRQSIFTTNEHEPPAWRHFSPKKCRTLHVKVPLIPLVIQPHPHDHFAGLSTMCTSGYKSP